MNPFKIVRALTGLAVDTFELALFVFDFSGVSDEIWAEAARCRAAARATAHAAAEDAMWSKIEHQLADELADQEAEYEVSEPRAQSTSPAASPPASDVPPSCSGPRPPVEQEGLQLTPEERDLGSWAIRRYVNAKRNNPDMPHLEIHDELLSIANKIDPK